MMFCLFLHIEIKRKCGCVGLFEKRLKFDDNDLEKDVTVLMFERRFRQYLGKGLF